jgi:hypothetical protein
MALLDHGVSRPMQSYHGVSVLANPPMMRQRAAATTAAATTTKERRNRDYCIGGFGGGL